MPVSRMLSMGCLILFLHGCAASGSMEQVHGPINTPAFTSVALDSAADGSEQVRFQEKAILHDDGWLKFGVFFITDRGAYFAQWNGRRNTYDIRYGIEGSRIATVDLDSIGRSMLPDDDIMVITDHRGGKANIEIDGRRDARGYLLDISRGRSSS